MTRNDGPGPRDERCVNEENHECGYRGTPDCRRRGGRGRGEGCRRGRQRHGDVPMAAGASAGGTTPSPSSVGEAPPSYSWVGVCAEGPALSDRVHDRFGRAGCFQLVDPTTMTAVVISNDENRSGSEGAGIGAVELLSQHGAGAAIVTKVGPKAADAFRRASIPVYTAAGMTVGEAVAALGRGELARLDLG